VRGLRNSRAAISGFDRPSQASCAIWRSWAVGSSRVSAVRLRTPLARGLELAAGALGERLHADRGELVVGGTELGTRVDTAMLAAQPLPVEQMRAGELRPQRRAAQAVERLAMEPVGGAALAQQRAGARLDAGRGVRAGRRRGPRQALERRPCDRGLARPHGGLDELREHPHRHERVDRARGRRAGGGDGLAVAAQAVAEDRLGPVRPARRHPLPSSSGGASVPRPEANATCPRSRSTLARAR
jgi:hypothetical protein